MSIHHAGRKVQPSKSIRGFSLIEVAVTVATVALLAVVVGQSLGRVHDVSRNRVCQQRLGRIAAAATIYSQQDLDGQMIPVHPSFVGPHQNKHMPEYYGAYEWGGKSGVGADDFLTGEPGDPLNSKFGTLAGIGPATRPLNEIMYAERFEDFLNPEFDPRGALFDTQLDLPEFRCPADDGPPDGGHCPDWVNHPERRGYDQFGTSYAANIFMIGSTAGGPMQSNSPFLRPAADVLDPGRTVPFEETIGRFAWAARRDQCSFLVGIDPGPTGVIRSWHGDRWMYNRAFVDGSAAYQLVYIPGTEDSEGFAEHYYPEVLDYYPFINDGFPCEQTDQEHTLNLLTCIIVRGDDWQKDTLPADLICTPFFHSGDGRPSYENCVSD